MTPNLDRFLAKADLFRDTTTPLARTFSSWMAILTGRAPTVTGARFNLAERSSVKANPTIGDVLQKSGYRTVYSTDEVRFANIDESYGFDQVVTPRIGASDFIIGTYNELPLASLVINTRIGKWLFPFSYANRGVATMFEPGTYAQTACSRGVLRSADAIHLAPDGGALALLHGRYTLRSLHAGVRTRSTDVSHRAARPRTGCSVNS